MKNKLPQVYFISGVSGIGKTTTISHLKERLSPAEFNIYNFDERGVPDNAGKDWLYSETRHWLDVGIENVSRGKSTIITGFSEPEVIRKISKSNEIKPCLILLDASGETIRRRLEGRYLTPENIKEINRASGRSLEKFVEDQLSYAPTLRANFEKEGFPVINTDNKTPVEVAEEIIIRIKKE